MSPKYMSHRLYIFPVVFFESRLLQRRDSFMPFSDLSDILLLHNSGRFLPDLYHLYDSFPAGSFLHLHPSGAPAACSLSSSAHLPSVFPEYSPVRLAKNFLKCQQRFRKYLYGLYKKQRIILTSAAIHQRISTGQNIAKHKLSILSDHLPSQNS